MKKRFFGILLMGAMVVASMSMFTSCKDYDDDINALKERIDANSKAIGEIQKLISNGGVVTSVTPIENGVRVTMSGNLGSFDITNGVNGKDGKDGAQGEKGADGQPGLNGKDGKDGTVWTIEADGLWYLNGEKTEYYVLGTSAGSTTTTIIEASPKYYIPNPVTGCFDIYQDGVLVENTKISFLGTGSITATMDSDVLTLYGIAGAIGPNNSVSISLTGVLKSMVFIPMLYLDGIESIEYPWIGDTILAYSHRTYDVDRQRKGQDKNGINLSHHGTYPGYNLQDIKGDLDDYLPNTLGRYLKWNGTWNVGNTSADVDGATGRWEIEKYDFHDATKDNRPLDLLTGNEEWIYGPVWPVQYELNPANSAVDYKNNAPNFKVLEPEVIYYNTRASKASLDVTSPEKYEYYDTEADNYKAGTAFNNVVFGAKDGDLTVGIKIAHPDKLAPWPTDETINPNGNTDSDVSYPAGNNPDTVDPYAGDKTTESYGSTPNPITYGSWYGYAAYKYNKNNKDNTVALQMENTDGEGSTVTSDYALIVPSRVTLEGMIWYQKPMYAEPTMPGYEGKDPQNLGVAAYGPKNRVGDEEGWAWFETGYVDGDPNTNGDCTKNRVHVWDSPQEALADPDGAALELNAVGDGLDLKPYLGVHVLKENIKHKETAPGVYNPRAYDLVVWDYNEVQKWGLHWEFELVEYISSTNVTSDSRYATFSDWTETESHTYKGTPYTIVKESIWNKKNSKGESSRTGVIIARNVTPDGLTTDDQSTSSVDREPLVRVLLKNAQGKVLLDGYILLHINNTPGNLEVRYPEADRTFDLCEPLTYETTWSQFSRYILTDNLKGVIASQETGAQRYAFDDWYWADCMPGTVDAVENSKFDGSQNVDDRDYVTDGSNGALMGNPYWTYPYKPNDNDARVTYHDYGTLEPVDGHNRGYQLKIYNFGDDIYGGGDAAAITAKIQAPGNHNEYLETGNEFENKALGDMIYFPNGEGTTNHTFDWYLTEEEIEYLTHHKKAEEFPVKVSRWFRFIAKDYDRERLVNNYSAPYPYVWVKMTMSITRKQVAEHFQDKIDNYWYQWNPDGKNDVAAYGDNAGTGKTASDVEKGWSAMVIDVEAPRDDISLQDDHKWTTPTAQTLLKNIVNLTNSKECKYYFAPKGEFVVEAIPSYEPDVQEVQKRREGKNRKYVITTRNKNYGEPFIVDEWGYVKATKYVNNLNAKDNRIARPNYNTVNPGYDPQKTYYNKYAQNEDLDYRNAPGAKTYYDPNDKNWTYNKIYCRYVWPHRYVNFEQNKYNSDNFPGGQYWVNYTNNGQDDVLFPFINNKTTIKTVPAYDGDMTKKWSATSDTYSAALRYYKADFNYWTGQLEKKEGKWDSSTDAHKWDEKTLKGTLDYCTMLYEDEKYVDANGNDVWRSAGAFDNDILYAVSQDSIYTPIARIRQQAYPGVSPTEEAGKFELIHYLPIGSTYADFRNGDAVENYVLYDVLNALGYPLDKDKTCEFDYTYRFLMHELNGWIGTVATNECNVARYMDQVKTDTPDNPATFVASWQRPINLDKNPIDVALDANTNENIIYLVDYLKLYDWRGYKPGNINGHDGVHQGYMWDNHLWFWAYYNIRKIEVDMNPHHIKTTMHENERPANKRWVWLDEVTTKARFYNIHIENYKTGREMVKPNGNAWVTYPEHATFGQMQEFDLVNSSNRAYTIANNNSALKAYMGYPGVKVKDGGIPTRKALFGGFYYENNGDNVTEFDVRIPITIWYEWGKLETVVEWHINTVHRY